MPQFIDMNFRGASAPVFAAEGAFADPDVPAALPLQFLVPELQSHWTVFLESVTTVESYAHCLHPDGMTRFLVQERVKKGLPVGAFLIPLVDPPVNDQGGMSVYDFLLFLDIYDSPQIATEGIKPYHGVALLQAVAFFSSTTIANPSWAGETLLNQQLATFAVIIQAYDYHARFTACQTDGAKWLQAILRAVQESLRSIVTWSQPPLRQPPALVRGTAMSIADPGSLRASLDGIASQLQHTISQAAIGTDSMLNPGSSP